MADQEQVLVSWLVTGAEAVNMCAFFLLTVRGHVLTEITACGTRMRYTLIGECSSFFAPFKLTNQDHF